MNLPGSQRLWHHGHLTPWLLQCRFKGDCAQMVRFVKCTEDILMELQGEEDFSTSAWQECLEV